MDEAAANNWPHRRTRPAWWISAADRDREADRADEAARLRDQAAEEHDASAARRDEAATGREREAAGWTTAAHQRLNDADRQDGKLWAAALAVVEAARAEHVAAGTEASRHSLIEAEARSEAQTGPLIAASIERHAIRDDLHHVAQHLAAAAIDRRAAATDRARTRLNRHAAADDRGAALAHRLQAAIDRSGERD
ncbi:MAG TPA: hypothetical protein VF557_18075 [Jatrophihabitans sp.]|jgi:hypothetical protein|uniref:hypothetical protein n=1 Tax=Jatrophihabitans sp. TaxID=1932789 RepID=UPI002F1C2C27